jgi:hypothetical protein
VEEIAKTLTLATVQRSPSTQRAILDSSRCSRSIGRGAAEIGAIVLPRRASLRL